MKKSIITFFLFILLIPRPNKNVFYGQYTIYAIKKRDIP